MTTVILADIGGTYARFARVENNAPAKARKLAVADYETLEEALLAYTGHPVADGILYIATAAWPYPDGTWRFARPDRWEMTTESLERAGWAVGWIGNDFGAGARGALAAGPEYRYEVQSARPQEIIQRRSVVLGSGTGLGLAYVEGMSVQETYGGHMAIPQCTDEQHTVIKLIRRLKTDERPVSAEDVISGPGLSLLYKAVCLLHGQSPDENIDLAVLLEDKGKRIHTHSLRLYHEFLGLFAHQAVIYGHAYAGLYMDGGVLHRLVEAGAFDHDVFLRFFVGDPLPLIKKQMMVMKIEIVTDPFVTLSGLAEIMNDGT